MFTTLPSCVKEEAHVYHKSNLTEEVVTAMLYCIRNVYHNSCVTEEGLKATAVRIIEESFITTTGHVRKFPAEGSCLQEQNLALVFKKLEDRGTNATGAAWSNQF